MPAEWDLRAYRVAPARLAAFVGSRDDAARRKILRASTSREIIGDYRLDPVGLDGALAEILAGKLDTANDTAYRIALEAILETHAARIKFELATRTILSSLTTYALRERVPDALTAAGLTILAKVLSDPRPRFPSFKKRDYDVDWPWATFVDRATLNRITLQITRFAFEGEEQLRSKAKSVVWKDAKKERVIVALANGSYAMLSTANDKTKKKAADNSRLIAEGALDDVLASVADADFEEAVHTAKKRTKDAANVQIAPWISKARWEQVTAQLTEDLDLDEYEDDIIHVVRALVNIMIRSDGSPQGAAAGKPFTSDTLEDGVMLFMDGEYG